MVHPKLTEIIHADFFDLSPIENQLAGYNACFFCLGVSSVGMKEPRFSHYTYDLTMHMATLLSRLNPDMTFCYISGTGTDSSEKGKMMWARVKGRTENDLMKLPFAQVYNFRPGIMRPTPGAKNTLHSYRYLMWLLPIIQWLAPHYICRLSDVGRAMIHAATRGYEKHILEIRDILLLSKD
jgi:hypothetical protein